MDAARLSDLLDKYVENDLVNGDRAELESLLKASPEARRYFWSYLHQHALLRKLMAEARGRTLAAGVGRKEAGRRFLVASAASLVLAVAGVLLLTSRPGPAAGPVPKLVQAAPAASPALAEPVLEEKPVPRPEPARPVEAAPPRPEPPSSPPPKEPPGPPHVAPPPPPVREPVPEPAPTPRPEPRVEPSSPTLLVAAQVEQVVGHARAAGGEEARLKAGQDVLSGQGVEVAPKDSWVVLRCADGTRLELGPGTRVREFRDDAGKRVVLERGFLTADVPKQPAARPMVVVTPHGEAQVLGTRFVVWTLPDSTRLEVRDGRVRVTRNEDAAADDVGADQRVVLAKGVPLAPKPARVAHDLVAFYRFDTGPVDLIRDLSGSGVPLDLEVKSDGGAAWKPAGLGLQRWSRIGSHGPAAKVVQACRKSRELTLEAWVVPNKASFRYTGFLVLLGDPLSPNAALLQGVSAPSSGPYQAQVRTSVVDPEKHAPLSSPRNLVEARPVHLVYARAANGAERLYVNGIPRAAVVRGGDFSAWKDDARLSLGLEWLGEIRLVAVYCRALKEAEVVRNFRLGVE